MKKLLLIFCLISLSMASTCSAMGWHKAAKTGNTEELKLLIKTEPQNINKTEIIGNTPLHMAVDEPGALSILLENGALAVINQYNENDQTPLLLAIQYDNNTAIRILLKHGALIHQPDNNGCTPLHWAATYSHLTAVRILLENGALAIINQPNMIGSTPLDRANKYNLNHRKEEVREVIKLLTFCKDLQERTPKEMATFLLTLYDRTGSKSPANVLPQDKAICRLIFGYVKHPSLPLDNEPTNS